MPLDEKDLDCQKMKTVYEKCDLVVTEMKRNDFASQDIEQDLRRLLGEKRFNTIKMSLIDDKQAMSSVSCLLNGLAVSSITYAIRNINILIYLIMWRNLIISVLVNG